MFASAIAKYLISRFEIFTLFKSKIKISGHFS